MPWSKIRSPGSDRLLAMVLTAATVFLSAVAAAAAAPAASPPATVAPAANPTIADPPANPPAAGLPVTAPETGLAVDPALGTALAESNSSAATPSAPQTLPSNQRDPVAEFTARVGAWDVHASGSPLQVGQYQSLQSSPFWDADGIFSDGVKTADLTATGTDNETSAAHGYLYLGPRLSATIDYQRFPHELDVHDFSGFDASPAADVGTNSATYTDFNPGRNYAIRVQELKADFKGHLTEDIKWRLSVFGLDKAGTRQANSMAHCFTAQLASGDTQSECHAVSNAQHIDWKTTEIEGSLEARLATWLTVEYAYKIRTFQQNDDIVTNDFTSLGAYGFPNPRDPNPDATGIAGYAFVPDSQTTTNRLKLHGQLDYDTDVYAMGFVGDTTNQFRDINRHFGGADLRVTNNAIQGLTVTLFAKCYSEDTQRPTTPLDTLYPANASLYQEFTLANVPLPVNRNTDAFGVNGRWRPFAADADLLWRNLSLTGGYEFSQIRRTNAVYQIATSPAGTFIQPDSDINTFTVGTEEKWSRWLTSYVRYKHIDTAYPLFGVTPDAFGGTDSPTAALNTNLPTVENRLELGSTWSLADNCIFNGTFFIEDAANHGPYANFDSYSYPFAFTLWYAPTPEWSLTCGYADFSNSITQNVVLGAAGGDAMGTPPDAFTSPWRYSAKANVLNVGTRYAWTKQLNLSADVEYVHGLNSITSTPTPTGAISYSNPPAPFQPLGSYSLVSMDTLRIEAGLDYLWRPHVTTYFRYNYYDFADLATGLASGQAHMLLGGVNAVF